MAINPTTQAAAQREANLLASRGKSGYRRSGHPGGNMPGASTTGTGYGYTRGSIPTCEPPRGRGTLIAAATARGANGEIYGVRAWSNSPGASSRQGTINSGQRVTHTASTGRRRGFFRRLFGR